MNNRTLSEIELLSRNRSLPSPSSEDFSEITKVSFARPTAFQSNPNAAGKPSFQRLKLKRVHPRGTREFEITRSRGTFEFPLLSSFRIGWSGQKNIERGYPSVLLSKPSFPTSASGPTINPGLLHCVGSDSSIRIRITVDEESERRGHSCRTCDVDLMGTDEPKFVGSVPSVIRSCTIRFIRE